METRAPFVLPLALPLSNGGGSSITWPFDIARKLAHRRGLSVLVSTDTSSPHGRRSFVACDPCDGAFGLDPLEGAVAPAHPGSDLAFAPAFIGVVPFEATRSRLERPAWSGPERRPSPPCGAIEWLRYDAVAVIDHEAETAHVVADDERAALRLVREIEDGPARAPARFRLRVEEDEAGEEHVARVRDAIERIFDGELYQVNLARRLRVSLQPNDPHAVLSAAEALLRAFPTAFGAVLRTAEGWVVSTSPELLLDASPTPDGKAFERIATEPIKGTRRRASDTDEDRALISELDADPKERAELAMIIDVERNDVARVSIPGTTTIAKDPHVVTHRTLHHRVARVEGVVRPGLSRADVLRSMVPSGSVTGAPKVRAMEIIAELEPMRRGLYTGGIGYVGRDGSTRLSMAIRTVVLDDDGEGEYLVGGGIVADSIPERELDETRVKAAQLVAVSASKPA
ncbi:MAG: anthranilate synthase component I family protein [Polyangiaceae bacterium]|nr:anthranilate synthase component I family protein [Polyangiaceae bacterium]